MISRNRLRDGLSLLLALVLLNGALTFHNLWPTPWVFWKWDVSVEVAGLVLVLAVWQRLRGRAAGPWLLGAGALLVLLLVFGHYVAVTAPSLYGREINLFWDSQHLAAVAGMFAGSAPWWMSAAVVAAFALACLFIAGGAYVCLRRVSLGIATPRAAGIAAVACATLLGLYAVAYTALPPDTSPRLAMPVWSVPVTKTYAHQYDLVRSALRGDGVLANLDGPTLPTGSLPALAGSDVLLFFVESYGATTYDRPDLAATLRASRADLAAAIDATGRSVVSAFVESPTFAGGSWLAHLTLMSGIDVRDPRVYDALMTQQRDTLATWLQRQGYRTVGLMPGIRLDWPEGAFYRFDALLDADRLDYRGPEFGWWRIPDQYAMAKFDELELEIAPRAPLFAMFTSITTHLPFLPTPPYQPDWQRLLTPNAFDAKDVQRSLGQVADWLDMGHDYAQSIAYTLESVAGYLRKNQDRDFLLIVMGDHQPAANVTGEGASWDVPVHVIASRPELLRPLVAHGFTPGLDPERESIGPMHKLLPMFAESFSGPATLTALPEPITPPRS